MTKHEDQLPIEEMSLEETLSALNAALAAFEKDYYSPVKAAQARARKASLTIEKLMKRFRKVTIHPEG
jgi:hypothetical protein